MDASRRRFLQVAGASVLGLGWGMRIPAALGQHGHAPVTNLAKRWAMVVDTTKCAQAGDCKDCRVACHLAHNVPELDDPAHDIKWIWKESYGDAFPTQVHPYTQEDLMDRPVPVLCNHCERPPCVRVCPTQATFKNDEGIISMDMHRCIGCRYCIAACPYGSRSFNWTDPRPHVEQMHAEFPSRRRGVVEKCNFCTERLANDQVPYCVEACKVGALVFGDLLQHDSEIAHLLRTRNTIRRRPNLGTAPNVFYIV